MGFKHASIIAPIAAILSVLQVAVSATVDTGVISIFGSSVANGAFCSGNCSGKSFDPSAPSGGCYQSRLREYQAKYKNRSVFNNCHGGDDTTRLLDRFYQLLSAKAGLVVIGLSQANEGLVWAKNYSHIFEHFENGLRELVKRIRASGAEPVVASNYPNSDYNEEQYSYIKRMNLLTQTWDLQTPQVNFLGTIDDGHGRWVQGFHANSGHPNDKGSTEMYYAFVPSLFDAIMAGKPAVPERASGVQSLTLQRGSSTEAVQFQPQPQDVMHSFTLSFSVRCDGCTGILAAIDAVETIGLSSTPGQVARSLLIDSQSGQVMYVKAASPMNTSSGPVVNDGAWHTLLLTHYWCNGSTDLVVDSQTISQTAERLGPTNFQLRPETSAPVSYQDLLIYRSGLNIDERHALLTNKTHVLQASLEIYAPLDGNHPTENRAQSMSEIKVISGLPELDVEVVVEV